MPRLYFTFNSDLDDDYYFISAEGKELSGATGVYFVIWQTSNKERAEKWLTPRCVNGFGKWTLDYQPCGGRGCQYSIHVYINGGKTYVDEDNFYVKPRAKHYYPY